jgi:hypothetical protein
MVFWSDLLPGMRMWYEVRRMSNLIPLDDRKIRKQAFASLEKLLKKLQRMEGYVESFHDQDERLFHEWFELTFRDDNREVASLRGQYRELADFHNHMHALAQMEDLALPEAAYLLREEERIYQSANSEQRREIEEDRRLREQFICSQTQRNERPSSASPDLDEEDLEEVDLLNELDDEELEEWCASSQTAFFLLGKTLRAANYSKDFELFFRLWEATHSKIQRDFARQFEKQHGYSLMEALGQMRERFCVESDSNSGEREEALKLQYRQLVRKLHPDVHESANGVANEVWRKKMWEQVQEAYQRQDLQELNRLFHLVLLRTRDLEQLRLSELHLSRRWISDEIERMSDLTKRLRRKPAWGFSRRKNFEPIKRKIERDLRKARRDLENQVIELRVHHAHLERLGRESLRQRRRRSMNLRFP